MKVEWQRDEIKWKEDKVCWRQARKDWEIDLANAKIQASNDHAEVNMNVFCSKYYNFKVTEELPGFLEMSGQFVIFMVSIEKSRVSKDI